MDGRVEVAASHCAAAAAAAASTMVCGRAVADALYGSAMMEQRRNEQHAGFKDGCIRDAAMYCSLKKS